MGIIISRYSRPSISMTVSSSTSKARITGLSTSRTNTVPPMEIADAFFIRGIAKYSTIRRDPDLRWRNQIQFMSPSSRRSLVGDSSETPISRGVLWVLDWCSSNTPWVYQIPIKLWVEARATGLGCLKREEQARSVFWPVFFFLPIAFAGTRCCWCVGSPQRWVCNHCFYLCFIQ